MHTLETTTLCVVEAEAEAAFRERMPRVSLERATAAAMLLELLA